MSLFSNYRAGLAKGTTLTKIEGKDVLFSVRTGESYGLNDMAALMLSTLLANDANTTIEKIAEEYSAPQDDIANDLNDLIKSLVDQKMIVTTPV